MHYIVSIILASVALCAAISPASNRFFGRDKVALNDPSNKNSSDGPKSLELPSSLLKADSPQVVVRQRRSLWTAIVKHMTLAIEHLQMKPLLVEGVNDANGFGKKMKDKIRFSSKPANVMLQEGAGKSENGGLKSNVAGGVTEGKGLKEGENKSVKNIVAEDKVNNKELKEEDDGSSLNSVTTDMFDEEDEEVEEKRLLKKMVKENKDRELKEEEKMSSSDLMEQIHNVQSDCYNATMTQMKILDGLMKLDKSEHQEEIMKLYQQGLNSAKAQPILQKYFEIKPELKEPTLEGIQRVNKKRAEIEKQVKELNRHFGENINEKDLELMKYYMKGIVEENDEWLYPDKIKKSKHSSQEKKQDQTSKTE